MKPKMFGSGTAAPKFSAGKTSGKKAMPGRRMQIGGATDDITPLTDSERAAKNRAAATLTFDAGRATAAESELAARGADRARRAARRPAAALNIPIPPTAVPEEPPPVDPVTTDDFRGLPVPPIPPRRGPAAASPARPGARRRGPTAGELEADRLTDLYNRSAGAAPGAAMPRAEMPMPMPMRRGGDSGYDYGGSGKTGGSVARGKIVKKMASGGGVKKMAAESLAKAPPKPSPDDEQNRFVPNARKKLLDAQKRQALLGMPEGLMHGGKVKKMAGGGSSGEMQAFMKGRRDARGSMAPRAAMMPKASMAPMAPKARMMSKAPMAPMASMLGMKSGGAARGNSRGNGCAVKGHARGRMV